MNTTRRNFLRGALAAAGVGVAAPIVYVATQGRQNVPARATAAPASRSASAPASSAAPLASAPASISAVPVAAGTQMPQPKSVVVIQLAGGNDGLSTVLPYADPALKENRSTLVFPDSQVLKLNDQVALHPNLKGIKSLYDAGKVAVVQGVGYPNPNRSHFQSMDIWSSGNPDKISSTGWLGRYLDGADLPLDNPFNAVNVGSALPFALKSQKVAVPTVGSPAAFGFRADPRHALDNTPLMAAFNQIYQRGPGGVQYYDLVDKVQANAVSAARSLTDLGTKYHPANVYPQTTLGRSLQNVAELMTGGFGTRIHYVTTGGFDTHANEKAGHDRLMSEISDAIAAFHNDLNQHGLSQNVVMMTWSEFGRRVKENGSGGTDHGTAAPLFVIGDGVKGGLVGEQPSLSKLDKNGDLNFVVDFRAVYNTILSKWLGMDGEEVLGAKFDILPIFH